MSASSIACTGRNSSTRTPSSTNLDSLHSDERDYHYGLLRADASPKLFFQLWSEGGLKSVKIQRASYRL